MSERLRRQLGLPCRWCVKIECRRPLPGGLYVCGWTGYRRTGDSRPCPKCWRDAYLIAHEVTHRLGNRCSKAPRRGRREVA